MNQNEKQVKYRVHLFTFMFKPIRHRETCSRLYESMKLSCSEYVKGVNCKGIEYLQQILIFKPLIFQTLTIFSSKIHSFKYQKMKDIGIRKFIFVVSNICFKNMFTKLICKIREKGLKDKIFEVLMYHLDVF